MRITIGSFELELNLWLLVEGAWVIPNDKQVSLSLEEIEHGYRYYLETHLEKPGRVRLEAALLGEEDLFFCIPCNIYGSNMAELVKKNQFPLLCEKREGDVFASPEWEFRADRSSHSVSMLSCAKGTVGIWVQPYSEEGGSLVRNGVFAKLPDRFGVSCGYGNFPVTFLEKENPAPSTQNLIKTCVAEGEIIAFEGKGRLNSHDIIRHCYYRMHQAPTFQQPIAEAAKAILDRFVDTNFKKEYGAYTNQCVPLGRVNRNLQPWRPLNEIGWTGGAVLAYPFLLASEMFGLTEEYWSCAKSPHKMIDEITAGYRETSGFLNDVVRPWNPLDNWSDVLVGIQNLF